MYLDRLTFCIDIWHLMTNPPSALFPYIHAKAINKKLKELKE